MRAVVLGAALSALAPQAGAAEAGPQAPSSAVVEHVRVAAVPVPPIRRGATDTLRVVVRIAAGMHVQANPAANEFLIPLTLELEPAEWLDFGTIAYPPPALHRLEDTGEALLTCDGTITIAVPVTMNRAMPERGTIVRGRLTYQACDAKRCFAPRTLPVTWRVAARR